MVSVDQRSRETWVRGREELDDVKQMIGRVNA